MILLGQKDLVTMRNEMDKHAYIYESPDGGKTIYRRKIGETSRLLIKKQPEDYFPPMSSIVHKSKTNTSLKKALDNLMLIYYTVKNDERK